MKTEKRDRQRVYGKSDFNGVFLSDFPSLLSIENRKAVSPTCYNRMRVFFFVFNVSFFSAFPSLSSSFTLDLATLPSSLNVSPPFCSSVVRFFRFLFSFAQARLDTLVSLVFCSFEQRDNTRVVITRAGDDPDASDPYFFVIDFGCGPTNFRSRRGGLSSNSEAASPLQHET